MAMEPQNNPDQMPIPWQQDPGPNHDEKSVFSWWRTSTNSGFNCHSIPDQDLDLYADLVTRHQSDEFDAISFFTNGKCIGISYQQLHDQVVALHRRWAQRALEPGMTLVIATRSPFSRIVGLLSAFRAGLVPTVLTPQGPTRLCREIDWLNPALIYGDRDLIKALPDEYRSRSLHFEGESLDVPIACGRQPNDAPGIRFFDPYQPGPEGIRTLSLGTLFNNLLRDAILVLGIKRGSRFAAFPKLSLNSPFAELAVLFGGGHYIGLDEDQNNASRELLVRQPFDVVHLPFKVATRWAETPFVSKPDWSRWYRDPLDSTDFMAWDRCVKALQLVGIPAASLHWSKQTGTIILGTPWNNTPQDLAIFAAAGVPWQLGELMSPKTAAKQGFGLYCQLVGSAQEPEALPSPIMIAQRGTDAALHFLGTHPKGRSGVPFPNKLAKAALATPDTWHVVVEQESPNPSDPIRYILLAFMDKRSPLDIKACLESEVGQDGVPDEVRLIGVLPRFNEDGQPDEIWIQRNFLNGELERRAKTDIYKKLSDFKMAILKTKPIETGINEILPPASST